MFINDISEILVPLMLIHTNNMSINVKETVLAN